MKSQLSHSNQEGALMIRFRKKQRYRFCKKKRELLGETVRSMQGSKVKSIRGSRSVPDRKAKTEAFKVTITAQD